MNTRIYKEYRILRPFWAIALLLPLVPLMLLQKWQSQALYCAMGYVVGCLLLGAASFGAEWNHQTMDLLLSQPRSRQQMWRDKIRVLALALGSLGLVYCLSLFAQFNPDEAKPMLQGVGALYGLIWLVLPIAWALGVGPFFALHVGNSLIAFVCSLASPLWWVLIMGFLFPADSFTGQAGFAQACCVYAVPLILLAVVGYRLARFQFHHLETAGFTSPAIRPIEWLSALVKTHSVAAPADTGGALGKLIRKELRLHEVSLLIAGWYLFLCALIMAYRPFYGAFSSEPVDHSLLSELTMVVSMLTALIIPMLAGAVAMAEERQIGILAWHLTLPPSRFRQWLVKTLTAYGCTVVLGILTPTALVLVSGWLSSNALDSHFKMTIYEYLGFCSISLLLTTISLVASSLSPTSLKAVLLSLGTLVLAGVTIGIMSLCGAGKYLFESPILILSVWSLKYWTLGVVATAAVLLMVGLSYANYRRLETRLSPVIQTVLVSLALVFLVFTPSIFGAFRNSDRETAGGLKGRAFLAHLRHETPQRVLAELAAQLNQPASAAAAMETLLNSNFGNKYKMLETLPLLVAGLTNSNPEVQISATWGIYHRRTNLQSQSSLFDRARVALYQNLLNTNAAKTNVAYCAAEVLGNIDTATIMDALNRRPADPTPALVPGTPNNLWNFIREKYVPLLVELYDLPETISPIFKVDPSQRQWFQVECDNQKRLFVIGTLIKLGPSARQAVPMLLKASQSEPGPHGGFLHSSGILYSSVTLRNRAIEALNAIDPEVGRSQFDRVRLKLYQSLLNTNVASAYPTAQMLARVDTATIIDALNRKPDDAITTLEPDATNDLGNVIRERFVPFLVESYNQPDPFHDIPGKVDSIEVRAFYSEKGNQNRLGVLDILENLGPGARQAIPMLLKASQSEPRPLVHNDILLRNHAIEVLTKIDPELVRSHNLEATTNAPGQK